MGRSVSRRAFAHCCAASTLFALASGNGGGAAIVAQHEAQDAILPSVVEASRKRRLKGGQRTKSAVTRGASDGSASPNHHVHNNTGDHGEVHQTSSIVDPKTVQLKESPASSPVGRSEFRVPRKIVDCGQWIWPDALSVLFPDWHGEVISLAYDAKYDIHQLIRDFDLNADDLFFGHLHKAESCVDGGVYHFPGKQLYFNPEPEDEFVFTPRPLDEMYLPKKAKARRFHYLPQNDNIYVIGPHETTSNSLQMFPGLFFLYMSHAEAYFASHRHDHNDEPLKVDYGNLLSRFSNPKIRKHNTGEEFAIYVQSHHVDVREQAVQTLSQALFEATGIQLHVGGPCQGNVHASKDKNHRNCLPAQGDQARYVKKVEADHRVQFRQNEKVFRRYKFVVTFENTLRSGYITEKIVHAFSAGSVPIYWGTTDIFDIFNPDAFVYFDVNNPGDAIDRILHLQRNPEEYQKMLDQPVLKNGRQTARDYFSLSDSVGQGHLRHEIMKMMYGEAASTS